MASSDTSNAAISDLKVNRINNTHLLNTHTFKKASLVEVLDAIENNAIIEEINISEKINDPLFRFITLDNKDLSYKFSNVLSISLKREREVDLAVRIMGNRKKIENANVFAMSMYEIVKNVQTEERHYSFNETARILNEKHIPTRKGKKWDARTIVNLNKRWKELGLLLKF